MRGERFGTGASTRWRALTVGVLGLALSVGLVSAEAAPSAPSSGVSSQTRGGTLSESIPVGSPMGPTAPAAAEPTTNNAVYAYDAASRLVGVTAPGGQTARYRYDAAGNRLGVDRFASSALSVLSLVPVRAASGASVTLSGTGFSTTAASNKVTFGTKTATVTSASATRLVVTVPSGAVKGPVSVAVGTASAASAETFTPALGNPSVTSYAPTSGPPGTVVVLSGSGFASAKTDNIVRFMRRQDRGGRRTHRHGSDGEGPPGRQGGADHGRDP